MDGRRSIISGGGGVGEWRLRLSDDIVILKNPARPRQEFLIGVVKLHKPESQAKCVIWICCSCGKMRKMANFVNEKVVSFDSAFEEALKCLLECSMSRALKSKQNEVISSTLVLERIYLPWCQLALRKAWYFGYWLAGKNPSSVVVVCQVMIKWINGLMVATLTPFRLEDIECEKYQLVFASAKNVLVRPLFYVDKNNTNNLPLVISQI